MTRTFVDSSALIAATRYTTPISDRALDVVNDADRTMLTSDFIRLEVLPKPIFHGRSTETTFYEGFFNDPRTEFAKITDTLIQEAFDIAVNWNLNAVDALHVAAAIQLQADELVTAERLASPLLRVSISGLIIVSIL
jgi:predicted nucleic acid-binding protein